MEPQRDKVATFSQLLLCVIFNKEGEKNYEN